MIILVLEIVIGEYLQLKNACKLVNKLFSARAEAHSPGSCKGGGNGEGEEFMASSGKASARRFLPMPDSPCGCYGYCILIATLVRAVKKFFQD